MSQYLLLKQGTIHNAVDEEAFVADILIEDGKIKKIAPVLEGKVINEAAVIDAMGIDVYPGLDGYAVGFAGQDFNELGDPVTPQLSAIDAINPQDETFRMAREGGVTCVSTGPGSSNVIGGTFCIIKTYGNRVDDMIVREKSAMKIAFGENPKNLSLHGNPHSKGVPSGVKARSRDGRRADRKGIGCGAFSGGGRSVLRSCDEVRVEEQGI